MEDPPAGKAAEEDAEVVEGAHFGCRGMSVGFGEGVLKEESEGADEEEVEPVEGCADGFEGESERNEADGCVDEEVVGEDRFGGFCFRELSNAHEGNGSKQAREET